MSAILKTFKIGFRPIACSHSNWAKAKQIPVYKFRRNFNRNSNCSEEIAAIKSKPSELFNGNHPFNENGQLYETLGVQSDASLIEIKAAYFRLAKRYHPDSMLRRYPNAARLFQKLTDAYHVLSDSTQRNAYDRLKLQCKNKNRTSTVNYRIGDVQIPKRTVPKCSDLISKIANDSLNNLKSEKVDSIRTNKSAKLTNTDKIDSEIVVPITFTQAIFGQMQSIDTKLSIDCQMCKNFSTKLCKNCNGRGTIEMEKTISIRIPSGVSDGEMLQINHPYDSKRNLKIRLKVGSHSEFKRENLNIATIIEVPWIIALLGGEVLVKTVYGESIMAVINPCTNSHTTICLKGKGIQLANDTGDHIATIKIKMPHKLTVPQKHMLRQSFS